VNRPLRRVAVACLVLFGLLLLNVNWVQVVKADAYRDDPRNSRVLLRTYERERGAIAGARRRPRREAIAESTRTEGPLTWLRQYPGGPAYAHVTGYYSSSTAAPASSAPRTACCPARTTACSCAGCRTTSPAASPGRHVVLTLDPRRSRRRYAGSRASAGAVVALDPQTGAVLAMVSRRRTTRAAELVRARPRSASTTRS
jgi:peptidoglycan glycosyltransferase